MNNFAFNQNLRIPRYKNCNSTGNVNYLVNTRKMDKVNNYRKTMECNEKGQTVDYRISYNKVKNLVKKTV